MLWSKGTQQLNNKYKEVLLIWISSTAVLEWVLWNLSLQIFLFPHLAILLWIGVRMYLPDFMKAEILSNDWNKIWKKNEKGWHTLYLLQTENDHEQSKSHSSRYLIGLKTSVLTSKRSRKSFKFLKASRHVGRKILCWSNTSYIMKSPKVSCRREKYMILKLFCLTRSLSCMENIII